MGQCQTYNSTDIKELKKKNWFESIIDFLTNLFKNEEEKQQSQNEKIIKRAQSKSHIFGISEDQAFERIDTKNNLNQENENNENVNVNKNIDSNDDIDIMDDHIDLSNENICGEEPINLFENIDNDVDIKNDELPVHNLENIKNSDLDYIDKNKDIKSEKDIKLVLNACNKKQFTQCINNENNNKNNNEIKTKKYNKNNTGSYVDFVKNKREEEQSDDFVQSINDC